MAEKPEPAKGELVFALLLLALGVAAVLEALRLGGLARLSGAGVFPLLAAGLLVSGAAVLVVGHCRGRGAMAAPGRVVSIRLVIVVAMIGGYVALLPALGFIAATGLFLLATLAYLWRRPLWQVLLVTAASLVIVQLVFAEVFQVVLPRSTLLPAGLW